MRDPVTRLPQRHQHGLPPVAGLCAGVVPAGAPLPHLAVCRVTGWIVRGPEHRTEAECKCLCSLCGRGPALAVPAACARALAVMWCGRRAGRLALGAGLAGVRLGGRRELRMLAGGVGRGRAAVLAALTAPLRASGAVGGGVTGIGLLRGLMCGRADVDLLRGRILLSS
ncbi:hypothetical protein [Streptomyces sp. NRRL B-1347]|uniref:hypothetical protein n=1 Tax=Streptomyces sp. NRRL B-1347 TaxID=1476877 RepID=UPI001F42BB2A|nr:hypothetical protein [Streptomyces sp. NRRL B-1347]